MILVTEALAVKLGRCSTSVLSPESSGCQNLAWYGQQQLEMWTRLMQGPLRKDQ